MNSKTILFPTSIIWDLLGHRLSAEMNDYHLIASTSEPSLDYVIFDIVEDVVSEANRGMTREAVKDISRVNGMDLHQYLKDRLDKGEHEDARLM